ncbi:MAG: helix-turn-helix transcriptional regulator [Candidatus Poribacteria bacterium]|nr:helix-turn-helix transcriptional regulator [Candidatus Poribacteria bacterium]|tara:strand:+ start:367 stop:771 length:405 start_codon:yes stop_codon:yes gene_type:complete
MPIKRKSNGSHVVDIHISQLIKDRRKQLAITQTELAKQSSLTPAAISQFESGTRKPSFDTLSNLADALKVTTDYLLGKRRENYDDLLADPKVSMMFKGMMELPEKDKEMMFEFYQFLRMRQDEEGMQEAKLSAS